ncbi:MAG: EAL domain-containing protein [Solirubrobacterales bacterium]|nr:EAL domain-containing protein [Solirubrobacterales bacterium]
MDALDDARELADALVRLLPGVGVMVIDPDYRVCVVEGNVHSRHGIQADAIVGQRLDDVLAAPAWEVVEGPWSTALAGGTETLDWASLDGEADYLLRFSPLRTRDGAVVGAVMAAQDISERWEAYRRMERRADQQTAIAHLGSLALHGMPVEQLAEAMAAATEASLGDGVLPRPTVSAAALATSLKRLLSDPRVAAGSLPRDVDDRVFLQAAVNLLAEASLRELRAAEARHREDQLNEAQRMAGMGSWEVDLRAGEPALSVHLREMLRIPDGATDVATMLVNIHPEDRDSLLAAIRAAGNTGHSAPVEFRVVGHDGAVRLLVGQGSGIVDGDGVASTLRGTVRDITAEREAEQALRRSEELFRRGFDASPIGMTLVHPVSGRFLRVNEAYCLLVGRSAEELLTLDDTVVVHPDDLSPEREDYTRGGSETLVLEERYMRPDGTVVWGSIHSARVLDSAYGVDVLFSQIEDVTERKAREETARHELEKVEWIREVHAALAEDRFVLYAQPIVDLSTGETIQHELLLRMLSPTGEVIPPGDFLPAAEQYGVIRDIDRWVIGRGAELAATGMTVEINLSGASMGHVRTIDRIDRAIERTGADPADLVFEITETAVIENVGTARRLAQRLRSRGCRFALDDFGTGFAGISSLKSLPLDYLKIDCEFVRDLCSSEPDRRVVAASIDLARGFGLQTIAEGVEDQATLDLLRELGVDHAQGYYLGRPAPIPGEEQAAG